MINYDGLYTPPKINFAPAYDPSLDYYAQWRNRDGTYGMTTDVGATDTTVGDNG